MRKVMAILAMVAWGAAIMGVLMMHFTDLEARAETTRVTRSNWPTAQGRIIDVSSHAGDPLDDNDNAYVVVQFQYFVGNQPYVAKQKWIDYTGTLEKANSYRKGQVVTVYYDPAGAGNGVIEWKNVDLSEVSTGWETMLRIIAFPSIAIGCAVIWESIAKGKRT